MPINNYRKSLSELMPGEDAILLNFKGGRTVNKRLASIGFTPGELVNMARTTAWGR